MSRDEKIALVESFLSCLVSKELDRIPVHADLTVESPRIPKLTGPAAIEYVKVVAAGLKGVHIIQHIVEGDHVATLFEEDTVYGQLVVFGKFQIESERIKDIRVFYDPRRLARST